MPDPSEYRPRLTIDISEDQANALRDLIPWGLRRELFSLIVDDVISMVREHGELAIAIIISKKLRPRDALTTLQEVDEKSKNYNRP